MRASLRRVARASVLSAVVALPSCVPRSSGPDAALAAYLSAVRAGRVDAAYLMMSDTYRKDHDAANFRRVIQEHRADVEAAVGRLSAASVKVELRAEARYGDGEALPLVMETGVWRIAADPLEFYPQSTPSEALRSFARAVERKRYDVILRFVPARVRKTVTVDQLRARWEGDKRVELSGELDEVRAHVGDPIEISGEEARLSLGDKRQARLVREDGAWRIESLR